ncbi:hypothetical protein [Rhizobium sp. CECT 9324]|uniref:hypothetical protein n=1 Tax=Rhizobium sp. CECT 9324 TaxID=2845820 RepID=UPI001E4FA2DB|nr:hypothetical protein [Rhizobium sp. CECT 9324]CAH0340049.1 hypothetical protein RHI9324_01705 [Rhizobium sp. CECT 9324]
MTAVEETGMALARLLRRALNTRLERLDAARQPPVDGRKQDRISNVTEVDDGRAGQ